MQDWGGRNPTKLWKSTNLDLVPPEKESNVLKGVSGYVNRQELHKDRGMKMMEQTLLQL